MECIDGDTDDIMSVGNEGSLWSKSRMETHPSLRMMSIQESLVGAWCEGPVSTSFSDHLAISLRSPHDYFMTVVWASRVEKSNELPTGSYGYIGRPINEYNEGWWWAFFPHRQNSLVLKVYRAELFLKCVKNVPSSYFCHIEEYYHHSDFCPDAIRFIPAHQCDRLQPWRLSSLRHPQYVEGRISRKSLAKLPPKLF